MFFRTNIDLNQAMVFSCGVLSDLNDLEKSEI